MTTKQEAAPLVLEPRAAVKKACRSQFTKYGDQFELMLHTPGRAALYRRPTAHGNQSFEVWKLRIDRKTQEEIPPSASQWGIYGWTFLATQELEAHQKYRSLVELDPSTRDQACSPPEIPPAEEPPAQLAFEAILAPQNTIEPNIAAPPNSDH